MAEDCRKSYFMKVEESKVRENELRSEIHKLTHGGVNQAIKPTGKLRFLTAYRFFRREEIPKIKQESPEMEGRQRHSLVKQLWRQMTQDEKFPFVLMSRADEERAKYQSEIAQIRNNLLKEVGKGHPSAGMVNDVFTRINKIIEEPHYSDEDEEDSIGDDEREEDADQVDYSSQSIIQNQPLQEESKEDVGDLSLSLINKQICGGGVSDEANSSCNNFS
jgi:hypothetical protein